MNPRQTWQVFNSFQQKIEAKFIRPVLKPMQKSVNAFVAAGMPINGINEYINFAPELMPILNNLYYQSGYGYGWAVYKDIVKQKSAAIKYETKAAYDLTPNEIALQVMNELRMSLLVNVHGIEQSVKERILYLIEQGIIQGQGFEETARLVSEVADIVRSRRIVRTESVKAANLAGYTGAQNTGLAMNKRWVSARDNRVRGNPGGKYPNAQFDHWDANGQVVPLDAHFIIGGRSTEPLLYPGDPKGSPADIINCRCVASWIPLRDANGRVISNETRTRPFIRDREGRVIIGQRL